MAAGRLRPALASSPRRWPAVHHRSSNASACVEEAEVEVVGVEVHDERRRGREQPGPQRRRSRHCARVDPNFGSSSANASPIVQRVVGRAVLDDQDLERSSPRARRPSTTSLTAVSRISGLVERGHHDGEHWSSLRRAGHRGTARWLPCPKPRSRRVPLPRPRPGHRVQRTRRPAATAAGAPSTRTRSGSGDRCAHVW